MGATVTYKYEEDLNRALKAFSLESFPVICISVVEHLSRISSVESELNEQNIDIKYKGSTIIVENIFDRSSRVKLRTAFECYGSVLKIRWLRKKDLVSSCEVTYQSTTNAVAAALALDGKTVHRSILRVKIKMTTKEIFIHKKVCEMF